MSRTLLINNADAVPAPDTTVTSPDEVAAARVAAFDVDNYPGGTLDLDAAFNGDRVQFVQGGQGDNDAIITSIIDVDDVKEVKEVDYIAPTAQVTTVTAEAGTGFATIRVVRADGSPRPHERITAEVELDNKTAAEIATEFANQLNAQSPDLVDVTTSTADIIITANLDYQDLNTEVGGVLSFATATDGEASGWTVDATTTPNEGSGSGAQVAQMEEIAYGGDYTNRIYLPVQPPKYANEAENYKLVTFLVKTNTTPNIAKSNQYQEITIALYDGNATDGIDLATFFGV